MNIERMPRGAGEVPQHKPVKASHEPPSSGGMPWELLAEYPDEVPVMDHVPASKAEKGSHVRERAKRSRSEEKKAKTVPGERPIPDKPVTGNIVGEFSVKGLIPESGDRTRAPFAPSVISKQSKRKSKSSAA